MSHYDELGVFAGMSGHTWPGFLECEAQQPGGHLMNALSPSKSFLRNWKFIKEGWGGGSHQIRWVGNLCVLEGSVKISHGNLSVLVVSGSTAGNQGLTTWANPLKTMDVGKCFRGPGVRLGPWRLLQLYKVHHWEWGCSRVCTWGQRLTSCVFLRCFSS